MPKRLSEVLEGLSDEKRKKQVAPVAMVIDDWEPVDINHNLYDLKETEPVQLYAVPNLD